MKKKIFITSFHVFISRNVIGSPVLDFLRNDPELEVVLIVPAKKVDYFTREFAGGNVTVEGIESRLSRIDDFFRDFTNAGIRTRARKRMLEMGLEPDPWGVVRFLSVSRFIKPFIPKLYRLCMPKGRYDWLFEKHKPDLVFGTDILSTNDIVLLHEAQARGIKTVAAVRSWDNMTSKGGLRVLPDLLVVNGEAVKEAAVELHGMPEARVRVIGIPHYDLYGKPVHSREEFCASLGFDPQKPILVFAPAGDRYFTSGGRVNSFDKHLLSVIQKKLLPDFNIIVRCPPADVVNFDGIEFAPGVVLERPGTHFGAADSVKHVRQTEIGPDDEVHLKDTLGHAAVVLNFFSSLIIDAAAYDVPIVVPGYELENGNPVPYEKSVLRLHEFEHMAPVLASGGVRVVKSDDELVRAVREYAADRSKDREKRRAVYVSQAYRDDKQSSRRLYEALKDHLNF